jgi:hypothetical protein
MAGVSLSHSKSVTVGFTGHRHLRHEERIAELLRDVITSLQHEIDGDMIGRSSVASGGDTLFAEACLASSLPWIALLPFSEAEFKNDFSEMDWARAKALLGHAARIETVSDAADRPGGYLDCGLATVEGADLMIALWDGKASRGRGGTAEIVAHARLLHKPLVLIHPESLEVKRERFSER